MDGRGLRIFIFHLFYLSCLCCCVRRSLLIGRKLSGIYGLNLQKEVRVDIYRISPPGTGCFSAYLFFSFYLNAYSTLF